MTSLVELVESLLRRMELGHARVTAVRFGAFEVDTEAAELRKNGVKVALQEQPFRVLMLLLEKPGKIVTREELQERLWPADTFVEFDRSLNTTINKVREALGDSAANPRFVETIPRRGYRFLAAVDRPNGKRPERTVPVWLAALAGALATVIGVVAWAALHHPDPAPNLPLRKFDLALENLTMDSDPVISPDGKHIAYIAAKPPVEPLIYPDGRHVAYIAAKPPVEAPRLRVYDLDLGATREIAGTEGAYGPFWSPDSRFIGFATADELLNVSAGGGVPSVLCQFPPEQRFQAGTWGADGRSIVFAAGIPSRLYEVPARGGHPQLLLEAANKAHLLAPHFLPPVRDEPSILFVARSNTRPNIRVRNLANGRERVLDIGARPVYSSTGHIVYQTALCKSGIWALPFSLGTQAPTGQAFPVVRIGKAPATADDGTLVYLAGGKAEQYRLAWVDRNGRRLGEIGQPQQEMILPIISPNGRLVGVQGWEPTTGGEIWVHDVVQGTKTRITRAFPAEDSRTIWSPDGTEIAFWSDRNGTSDVFIQAADGSGEARPVLATPSDEFPEDWSSDGNYIVVTVENLGVSRCDLWYLKKKPDGGFAPFPFLEAPGNYRDAAKLSPDGRFLAYVSSESGRHEVWVSPFPQAGQKWQVTTTGGAKPRWSRDGKELFYVQGDTLFTVPVSTTPTFSMGRSKRLFNHPGLYWVFRHATYDVSPDGKKFVGIEPVGPVPPVTIRVVQNWFTEFRGRAK